MIYRVLRWMARLALHVFFRQIEIEAQENVPSTGPVILAPNHSNALVDPMVVVISTQRCVTITAKSALARNPLLACLMHALGVVTFQRKQDRAQGSKPRPNLQSLERCRKILAAGGTVCIFPEGVSHSDAHLRVYHTGAARIALDFIAKDGNPGRLQIVPIGLLYSEKDRFRSAVWLRFGTPLDPAAWLARHPEGGAVELTQEIRRRVADLTLNYETRRESAILHWAAEIAGTGGEDPPPLGFDTDSVSQWFQLLERLQLGYEALLIQDRSTVESLVRRVRRYRSKLKRLGISPREVFLPMHPGRAALFIVRELELVVVGAPMAFFGIINHWLPYRTVKFFARATSVDKDHWASNIIYPSLLVFPFFYCVQLSLAWALLPISWAALYSIMLPYTGYYALLYRDRLGQTWRRTRTFLRFLVADGEQQSLVAEGRALVASMCELGTRVESAPNS